MEIIQSAFLGLIQGFTEFLPVSSSGHLILVPKIFNWSDQGLFFDVILHLGTFFAVLFVLRKKIKEIVVSFFKNPKQDLSWVYILIGIIPAGLAGFFLEDLIENSFRSVSLVAFNLIFWGAILWLAEIYHNKQKELVGQTRDIKGSKAFVIGLFQVLSLFPGTSRSGITVTAGLFSGFSKKTALEFSFLMSLPLILGATIFKFIGTDLSLFNSSDIVFHLVGFISSLIFGALAIKLFFYVAKKSSFKIFAIYRIILGIILLIFFI